MTDPENTGTAPEKTEVEKLRDEFSEQFATMRTSFENQIEELKKQNADLSAHNKDLERALIRSAVTEPVEQKPAVKSDEELYNEQVQSIAQKALKRF